MSATIDERPLLAADQGGPGVQCDEPTVLRLAAEAEDYGEPQIRTGASGGNGGNGDDADEEPPYSPRTELAFFFRKGIPLGLSAVLEWGVPPVFSMFMMGQQTGGSETSADLQAALGYGRVFYNCSMLMILIGFCAYFQTVLPGCIGAGRKDRIPTYLYRSLAFSFLFMAPMFVLQFFAGDIFHAVGIEKGITDQVNVYCQLMTITGALLIVEVHLECLFINLGYVRCAALNSLLTGLGVDIVCTWFFIRIWSWGMLGAALVQIVVRCSRIFLWMVFVAVFRLHRVMFVIGGDRRRADAAVQEGQQGGRGQQQASGRREEEEEEEEVDNDDIAADDDSQAHGRGPSATPSSPSAAIVADPIFSVAELKIFLSLNLNQIANFLSGWFVFELQIVAMAHIADIPKAAVAAGAIWIQLESCIAAVQNGWITATNMRTLNLLGKMDRGAPKAFAMLCGLSALVVAVTNVPLLVGGDAIASVVSNDTDVQYWFRQIVWILVIHSQTRISCINAMAIFVPIGQGKRQLVANIVAFYLIGAPIGGVLALTDLGTTSVAAKMGWCVAISTIAQTLLALYGFIFLARLDWAKTSKVINERANTDKKNAGCGGGAGSGAGSSRRGVNDDEEVEDEVLVLEGGGGGRGRVELQDDDEKEDSAKRRQQLAAGGHISPLLSASPHFHASMPQPLAAPLLRRSVTD